MEEEERVLTDEESFRPTDESYFDTIGALKSVGSCKGVLRAQKTHCHSYLLSFLQINSPSALFDSPPRTPGHKRFSMGASAKRQAQRCLWLN